MMFIQFVNLFFFFFTLLRMHKLCVAHRVLFHLFKYHLSYVEERTLLSLERTKSNERLAAILFPRYLYVRARPPTPGRILAMPTRETIYCRFGILPIKSAESNVRLWFVTRNDKSFYT